MRRHLATILLAGLLPGVWAPGARALNKETIETIDAYVGQTGIRVDVFGHNESSFMEYFNLIVFDDAKLEYVGIAADRGSLWYGYYPTHVTGNRIYVHGINTSCFPPDVTEPGSPLFHITFNVKQGVAAGAASLAFSSEGVWNGHWNDCSGYQISPTPTYYSGAVNVLGHAGHITIGNDSAEPGGQAVVDVSLHNDLDLFEYFNQILFDDAVATVDSIAALRGALSYGNYPTHVSGDTIFVHGWAAGDDCFAADHSHPGAGLYRIHFTVLEGAPSGAAMPLAFLEGSALWNHWVGCDLTTTDAFTASDGYLYVEASSAVPDDLSRREGARPFIRVTPLARGAEVEFWTAVEGPLCLSLFDVAGRRLRVLEEGFRDAGWHRVLWDGMDGQGNRAPAGVHFLRLQSGTGDATGRILVVR